jgi:protease-4
MQQTKIKSKQNQSTPVNTNQNHTKNQQMAQHDTFDPSLVTTATLASLAVNACPVAAKITTEKIAAKETTFAAENPASHAKPRTCCSWIVGSLWWIALAWAVWQVLPDFSLESSNHTALVAIRGEINSQTSATVLPAMRAALDDPYSQALVLLINSPGGSPVQAGLINTEITRLRAHHNKPIYAVVEETCASAAYYIAVATDEIYVDKASLVGSIGVVMPSFGYTTLMEKVGVERRLLTAGQNKGMLDPFSAQTDTHRQHVQVMLDQIHQQFIQAVIDGRRNKLKQSPGLFSGLFWSGQQAVDLGLADKFGGVDSVARQVDNASIIIDYSQSADPLERLVKHFGAAVGAAFVRAVQADMTLQ